MTYAQMLKCNRKSNIINHCHTRKQNECTRIWNVVLANWKVLAKEVVNISHGILLTSWKNTYLLKTSKSLCCIWKPFDRIITITNSNHLILITKVHVYQLSETKSIVESVITLIDSFSLKYIRGKWKVATPTDSYILPKT